MGAFIGIVVLFLIILFLSNANPINLKKCPYCISDIPKKASICPKCHNQQ